MQGLEMLSIKVSMISFGASLTNCYYYSGIWGFHDFEG